MTQQEIFNKVVKHLLTQKQPAMLGTGCMYRSPAGLMCAVGCLIPDELYIESIEGLPVYALIDSGKFSSVGLTNNNSLLLGALQSMHDHLEPSKWPQRLAALAEEFKLDMPEVQA